MATMERPRPSEEASAPVAAPVEVSGSSPVATVVPAADASAAEDSVSLPQSDSVATIVPDTVAAVGSATASAPPATAPASAAVEAESPASTEAAAPAPPVAAPAVKRSTATKLSASERREAGMLAELYSILVATEHLESAFVRGAVSNQDYERNCMQLLAQFKTLKTGLRDKCPDVREFIRQQGLQCPLAEERLLGTGVAATALYRHGDHESGSGQESLACFKASEGFITLRDALELKLDTVDTLMPLVRDLQASIVSIPNLPQLAGLSRIAGWLVTLNNMRASDKLDDDQCRQLSLDVEQAYTSLKNFLQDKR